MPFSPESKFAVFLDLHAAASDTQNNLISDDTNSCVYGELPARFEQLERLFSEEGISPSACLAVEAGNSLNSALLLLTLLRNGNSFVLTPPAVVDGLKPTPNFCSHQISELCRPERNPSYNGKRTDTARLYLRTSGSMGHSKLVAHTHERLLGNAGNCVRKYNFTAGSRASIPVPIAHMYGFGAEFLPAILAGAAIDLQDKTNILKYLDREKRFEPTIAFVTPSICDMLLKGYKTPRSCYDVMVTSGQRIGAEKFKALDTLLGGRLVNQYGSTEMGATAACNPEDNIDRKIATVGDAMPGVELRVDGSTGELYCKHPYGFEGYVDEDGEWLNRMEPGEWYGTGDLAEQRPDGSITVLGRADASINRSGYLVLLSDIERTMGAMEAVGEVAVVAGKNEGKRGLRIVAFCVPRSGLKLDGVQVRERCFHLLPHYSIPDEVRVVDRLPCLPSGKVDRQTLSALIDSRN